MYKRKLKKAQKHLSAALSSSNYERMKSYREDEWVHGEGWEYMRAQKKLAEASQLISEVIGMLK